jgi:glutathione S-transferase
MVPCLVDDNVGSLAEHGAILTYLSEEYKLTSWYPTDPATRGKIQFWINWNHTHTRHGTMGILVGRLYPDKFGAGLEVATKKYTRAIKFMEAQIQEGKFLAGTDHPTIADLSVITEMDQLNKDVFDFFDFSAYPKVSAWLRNVSKSVPSYKAVHDPIVSIAKVAKKHSDPEKKH